MKPLSSFFKRFQIFLNIVFVTLKIDLLSLQMKSRHTGILLSFFLSLFPLFMYGQAPETIPLSKPGSFKDKILRAEKTEDIRSTIGMRLYQGMVTHYNYYYNAHTKLNAIVQKAQLANQDDFTELLPYYDYSLKTTEADSIELDSVMMKATAGIVLHDLRNSYTDNLFLLIGKAYFFWNKLDSAYRIFQYINYQFYPKDKNEYQIVIGSGSSSKNGSISVASREKKGIISKSFSRPPSRNEALLWLAKTYAESEMHDEAVSLIHLLKKDKFYPKRLKPELDDVLAYSFYKKQMWDSAAFYLKKCLSLAKTRAELGRREFLLAQLYALTKKSDIASGYYNRARKHTNDPVMLIHARVNDALLVKDSSSSIDASLNELMKLARKERFDGFEDLLYLSAADIALLKKDTALALNLLSKSVRYPSADGTTSTRNKAYLKLGNIATVQRNYPLAANCFDSLNLQDPSIIKELPWIEKRKTTLKDISTQIETARREDSLQRIAAMPEAEREAYLKALLRKLRKEKGLKEDIANASNAAVSPSGSGNNPPPSLFTATNAAGWYFNVNAQKSKGPSEFRSKWGTRPNQDNWRRQEAIDAAISMSNQLPGNPGGDGDIDNPTPAKPDQNKTQIQDDTQELSMESLRYPLPLTDEKKIASDQNIYQSLFREATVIKNQLEDYEEAARIFAELYKRFPENDSTALTLFELYYYSLKKGDAANAEKFRQLMQEKDTSGILVQKTKAGKTDSTQQKEPASEVYQKIYESYLEGKFDEARKNKIKADSIYGTIHWTPQLMYIEAVYFANVSQDSLALQLLNDLMTRYGTHPITEKASVLKDVLIRRKEIEQHLRITDIVRQVEPASNRYTTATSTVTTPATPSKNTSTVPKGNSTSSQQTTTPPSSKATDVKKDSSKVNTTAINQNNIPVKAPVQIQNQTDTVQTKAPAIQPTAARTDSSMLIIALLNISPIYRTECLNSIQGYLKGNQIAGQSGCTALLQNGQGNYGWIVIHPNIAEKEGAKAANQLKGALPQLLYFLPEDKYQLIRIAPAAITELSGSAGIDPFIQKINELKLDKN